MILIKFFIIIDRGILGVIKKKEKKMRLFKDLCVSLCVLSLSGKTEQILTFKQVMDTEDPLEIMLKSIRYSKSN